jgi:hypothetical protein
MDILGQGARGDGDGSALPNVTKCGACADRLNDGEERSPSGLDERQLAAMRLFVAGMPIGRIAKELDVSRQTLFRWQSEPDFARELRRRREAAWDENTRRIQGMVGRSLDILEHHLTDRYERVRFRAAQAILSISNVRKFVPPPSKDGKDGE